MISCVGPVNSTQFMHVGVLQISGLLFSKADVPVGMLVTSPLKNRYFTCCSPADCERNLSHSACHIYSSCRSCEDVSGVRNKICILDINQLLLTGKLQIHIVTQMY